MSTLNDESMQINMLKDVSNDEIAIFGNLFACRKIQYSLKWKIFNRNWINSSKESDPPPDFYNDKLNLMMDVMRIDDCAFVDNKGKVQNRILQREGEIYNKFFKDKDREDLSIFIIPNLKTVPTDEDHNFNRYYNNFVRVFKKHETKIDLYKSNHPKHKVIFFIFDESSAYLETKNINDVTSEKYMGKRFDGCIPHFFCYDKQFVEIIKESRVDYVIWLAPFKLIQCENNKIFKLPKCAIYDVKNINEKKLFKYNHKMMISSEE